MSEEARDLYRLQKIQFNDRKKVSVVLDRAMSNVYENTIFLHFPMIQWRFII